MILRGKLFIPNNYYSLLISYAGWTFPIQSNESQLNGVKNRNLPLSHNNLVFYPVSWMNGRASSCDICVVFVLMITKLGVSTCNSCLGDCLIFICKKCINKIKILFCKRCHLLKNLWLVCFKIDQTWKKLLKLKITFTYGNAKLWCAYSKLQSL